MIIMGSPPPSGVPGAPGRAPFRRVLAFLSLPLIEQISGNNRVQTSAQHFAQVIQRDPQIPGTPQVVNEALQWRHLCHNPALVEQTPIYRFHVHIPFLQFSQHVGLLCRPRQSRTLIHHKQPRAAPDNQHHAPVTIAVLQRVEAQFCSGWHRSDFHVIVVVNIVSYS